MILRLIFLMCVSFSLILVPKTMVSAQSGKTLSYLEASWSPDGKQISFTQKSDGGWNIYKMRADGSNVTKLTNGEKVTMYSNWSPDGKEIVFASGLTTGDYNIFFMNVDGLNIRQLTKGVGRNTAPTFSPDGRKIAFHSSRDGGKNQLYVMNRDGSDQKRLVVDVSASYLNPMWSPEGKRIAITFNTGDSTKSQIMIVNADGSQSRQITDGLWDNTNPVWSRDGKTIFFTSKREGKERTLYQMSVDGENIKPVCNALGYLGRLAPNDKKIVYLALNTLEKSTSYNSLYLLNINDCQVSLLKE